MALTRSSKKLDSRAARRVLPQNSRQVHWLGLSEGRSLGYRKSSRGGVWLARLIVAGFRGEEKIGIADDVLDADGVGVLDFGQAQAKARDWFLQATREATGEIPVRKGRGYTVGDAVEEYLEALEHRASPTVRASRYDLGRWVLEELGDLRVDRLTSAKLSAWHAGVASTDRRRGKKKSEEPRGAPTPEQQRQRRSSANRVLTRVKAALNLALERGRVNVTGRAWRSVKPFRGVEQARAIFLSPKQQAQLVRACAQRDFQDLVRAALYSGLRLGELVRLRASDLRAGTLYAQRGKAGRDANPYVYLSDEGAEFFSALAKNLEPEDLLLRRSDGRAWDKEAVRKVMVAACRAAGLAGVTFHILRHSAASTWLMEGASLAAVARQLGHSDTRMVSKFYGHLADEHLRETFGSTRLGLDKAARATPAKVIELPRR